MIVMRAMNCQNMVSLTLVGYHGTFCLQAKFICSFCFWEYVMWGGDGGGVRRVFVVVVTGAEERCGGGGGCGG